MCISTSFRVLCAPNSWLKSFLGCFQPFLFISNFFRLFFNWNQEKFLKNIWKICVLSYSWDRRKCIHISTKRWKQLKKTDLPTFRVRPAPKSWSKYTTNRNQRVSEVGTHTSCLKFLFWNFEIFQILFSSKIIHLIFFLAIGSSEGPIFQTQAVFKPMTTHLFKMLKLFPYKTPHQVCNYHRLVI